MQIVHTMQALRAVTTREIVKFVQQRGRLLSALVRPLMWLAVLATFCPARNNSTTASSTHSGVEPAIRTTLPAMKTVSTRSRCR